MARRPGFGDPGPSGRGRVLEVRAAQGPDVEAFAGNLEITLETLQAWKWSDERIKQEGPSLVQQPSEAREVHPLAELAPAAAA